MKNKSMKYLSLVIIMLVTISITAQRGKIKGNRIVGELSESLKPFTAIKVIDGLEVTLIKDATEGYDLEMDENLFDAISLNVRDSTLVISAIKNITRSKKLDIIIRYKQINAITVQGKSKVISGSSIESDNFALTLISGGYFEGDIVSTIGRVTANENSKCELTYRGDDITFIMSDNAFAEVDVNTNIFNITASGRSDINVKGNAAEAMVNVMETSELNGKVFDVDQATVSGRDSGKVIMSVDKDIIINLDNKSEVQLYGMPAIVVEQLAGTSKILKMEL